jgi:hypothetical protein
MNKRGLFLFICCSFLLLIGFISNVSAVKITEVELNPTGTDAGNEWVEFYNEGEISLEDYQLINKDGDNINLSGSFNGYFIYTFAKQWLDNSDESISLYKSLEVIDKADLSSKNDDKNNDLTYQLCNGDWNFINSTKGKENNCVEEEKTEDKAEEELEQEETTDKANVEINTDVEIETEEKEGDLQSEIVNETEDEKVSEKKQETIELKPINLTSKNIKSEESKESLKRTLSFTGIAGFCIVFGALFLMKRKNKNEFRE